MNLPGKDCRLAAIAVDLDGTLLNDRAILSDRNRRALEGCIARNIPVILATSRPTRLLDRIIPEGLLESCSKAVMNGAVVFGIPPLSGYSKKVIPEEVLRDAIDLALSGDDDTRITLEIEGYEFGANWRTDADTLWQRNSATPEMVLTIEEAISRQPCKIVLGGLGEGIMDLAGKLDEAFGDTLSVIPALTGPPLLNITHRDASKPAALRELLEPVGISLEDVMAFGDDIPDLEMMRECGHSVAMANAVPEVRDVCRYQTASNEEDGVAVVLEKVVPPLTGR